MCLYLSRIRLDPADPAAARTLGMPYRLHQAVFAGFDAGQRGQARVLYRVEPEPHRGRPVVLVQSPLPPDWRAGDWWGAEPRFDGPSPFDPSAWGLAPGARLRFRLRANPAVKQRKPDDADTRRYGLLGEPAQTAWLARKLADAGSELADVQLVDEGLIGDGQRHWRSVRFDGHLRVTDPALLQAAVAGGIGPAKGFGFGLLSLAP
jgi:CRISPR system Cascade subunit CasE